MSGGPPTRASGGGRHPAPEGELRIRALAGRHELRTFVDASWRIHSRDALWIAPPRTTIAAALDPRKHPFHQHSDVSYFLAERDGTVVGRIASIVNRRHNAFHQERTGFFGLFDCEDDPDAAAELIDTVAARLRAASLTRMRGPVSFSTNEEIQAPGVLVEGFDRPPAIAMPYNPPRYAALLEGTGLRKCIDLLAYGLDDTRPHARLTRSAELLPGSGARNDSTVQPPAARPGDSAHQDHLRLRVARELALRADDRRRVRACGAITAPLDRSGSLPCRRGGGRMRLRMRSSGWFGIRCCAGVSVQRPSRRPRASTGTRSTAACSRATGR